MSGTHVLRWYSAPDGGWRTYSFHLGTIDDVALERATEIMAKYAAARLASIAVLQVGMDVAYIWSREGGWVSADWAPTAPRADRPRTVTA